MQWVCDSCGARIKNTNDGYVEWLVRDENGKEVNHSPRIVHARFASPRPNGCQYNQNTVFSEQQSTVRDGSLNEYVGTDGLITLLSYVSDKYFSKEPALELIMRLQVPDYDLVRRHFDEAIGQGVFEPDTKPGYYNVGDIQAVKQWLEQQE